MFTQNMGRGDCGRADSTTQGIIISYCVILLLKHTQTQKSKTNSVPSLIWVRL